MIKALPTYYRGYHFRSRLEARWAVFFDDLGIQWEYELEGFEMDGGEWYLPDFYLPRFHYPNGIYVEVKPPGDIFHKAHQFVMSGGGAILCAEGTPEVKAYTLIEPNHEKELADCRRTPVTFIDKYLPGGRNGTEYRLFWWPGPHDLEADPFSSKIETAIYRCRRMRFEEHA